MQRCGPRPAVPPCRTARTAAARTPAAAGSAPGGRGVGGEGQESCAGFSSQGLPFVVREVAWDKVGRDVAAAKAPAGQPPRARCPAPVTHDEWLGGACPSGKLACSLRATEQDTLLRSITARDDNGHGAPVRSVCTCRHSTSTAGRPTAAQATAGYIPRRVTTQLNKRNQQIRCLCRMRAGRPTSLMAGAYCSSASSASLHRTGVSMLAGSCST